MFAVHSLCRPRGGVCVPMLGRLSNNLVADHKAKSHGSGGGGCCGCYYLSFSV